MGICLRFGAAASAVEPSVIGFGKDGRVVRRKDGPGDVGDICLEPRPVSGGHGTCGPGHQNPPGIASRGQKLRETLFGEQRPVMRFAAPARIAPIA